MLATAMGNISWTADETGCCAKEANLAGHFSANHCPWNNPPKQIKGAASVKAQEHQMTRERHYRKQRCHSNCLANAPKKV